MLVDVHLDVLPVVAVCLGEQNEDLADLRRWPVPSRRETVLGVSVEYHVCRRPGAVVLDQQRSPVHGHVWPGHLELLLDVMDYHPPPANGASPQPDEACWF